MIDSLTPPIMGEPSVDAAQVENLLAAEIADAKDAEYNANNTCKDVADWLLEPDEPDNPLIQDLIEAGENVAIVGQSKAGKSFITLQMAICVAMGLPFLKRETQRHRVYIANLEVSSKQYKKRMRKLCEALKITPGDLRGWLFVDNLKGETADWDVCRDRAKHNQCDVVFIDPFYQIARCDENNAAEITATIEQMKKYQKDGITMIIVYHSPKGFSGDRQLIDMISGSGILARFPETIIGILNHAMHNMCRVVKTIVRNYEPQGDVTIEMINGVFETNTDIVPIAETSRSHQSTTTVVETTKTIAPIVNAVLDRDGVIDAVGVLVTKVQDEYHTRTGKHIGKGKVEGAIKVMITDQNLVLGDRASKRGGAKPIGTPEQMQVYLNQQKKGGN